MASFKGLVRVLFVSAIVSVTLSSASMAYYDADQAQRGRYPKGPHAEVTPGTLCNAPDAYRYPEKIAYCKRDVNSFLKKEIIRQYDEQFGYSIGSMERNDFKIDHYIPLCAGGGNEQANLWPQHKSVYAITDPMEPLVCGKMAEGKLSQKDAIELIRQGKNDLSKVDAIIEHLQSL